MSELPNSSFPLLLFDGLCNLCHGSVQFVLRYEKPDSPLHFGSLESEIGQIILAEHQLAAQPESLVLIENGKAYRASTGALRMLRYLRFPWPLFTIFLLVPAFIRNAVYYWIGRNRYRWFGKKESCPLPEKKWAGRFL